MVDEAHRLRTAGNKLTDCLAAILARGEQEYGFQLRLLMTGTPLQVGLRSFAFVMGMVGREAGAHGFSGAGGDTVARWSFVC